MLFLLVLQDRPDDAAFLSDLYDTHYRLLYGQALKVLRHRQDAEDVVQAAMLKLTSKISLLRGLERNKVPSYLVITVRNTAINLYRQKASRQEHQADVPLEWVPDSPQDSPESRLLAMDGVARIRAALQRLPQREKDAMTLRYVQGLSDEEVANALGVKAASARGLLSRGRQRLKDILREGGD